MLKRNQHPTYQILLSLFCTLTLVICSSLDDVDLSILNITRFMTMYGSDPSYVFGYRVSSAGDFNGDGIDDIIIGAPSGLFKGKAYLIYGRKDGISNLDLTTPLTSSQGFQIIGEDNFDYLGASVGTAGDFNGDGITDIIIGSPYLSPNGAVYIIFGTKTPPVAMTLPGDLVGKGFKISGTYAGGAFGISVAYAGDVNGDGLSDVIIGAAIESYNAAFSGSAYVIFGRSTGIIDITVPTDLTSDRGFYVRGQAGNLLGMSVRAGGDVNGDDIDDIIIGTQNVATEGDAYIVFGRKTGFTNYDLTSTYSANEVARIHGITVGSYFGVSVSPAGDINGDGIADILIGEITGTNGAGAVYVIFGQRHNALGMNMATDFDSSKGFVIYAATPSDSFATSVSNVGDFNGDGISDIIIGAIGVSTSGAGYLIYGSRTHLTDIDLATGLPSDRGFIIQGTSANTALGYSSSSAGDFNGDGGPDIIIGAPSDYNPLGDQTGSAFIIFGVPAPVSVREEPTIVKAIVQAQSAGAVANQAAATVLFFSNVNVALPLLFAFLVDILFYVRYLQILYPPRLRYMIEQPDKQYISINYISSAPQQLVDYLQVYDMPEKFEFYGFDSSFLVNFWPSIMMFLIVLVIIIIALLLEYATRSKKWLNENCIKFKQSMKWNYLIAMFTGYFCDISLYTFLGTRTVEFDSFLEVLSFMTCLFMNLLAAFMLAEMYVIIKKLRVAQEEVRVKKTKGPEYLEKLKESLADFETIFKGYKDDSFLQQSYLLLFSLRFYIFYVIVGYLFDHPIVQTSMINVMGLLTIIYIAVKRPFEDKKDLIMSLIQEVILQVVNISAFALAVTDDGHNENDGVRVVFGDIIIVCNIAFVLVGLVYSAGMLILMLRDFYHYIKKNLRENKPKQQKKSLLINEVKVKARLDKPQPALIPNATHEISPVDDSQCGLNVSSLFADQNSDIHLNDVTPKKISIHSPQKRLVRTHLSKIALHYQTNISFKEAHPIQIDESEDSPQNLKLNQNHQVSPSNNSEAMVIQDLSNSKETIENVSSLKIPNNEQTTTINSTSLHYRRDKALRKI